MSIKLHNYHKNTVSVRFPLGCRPKILCKDVYLVFMYVVLVDAIEFWSKKKSNKPGGDRKGASPKKRKSRSYAVIAET